MSSPILSAMNIYPVKSTAGLAVDTATVQPEGLAGDRRWVVRGADGQCITGREAGELVRVSADFEADGLRLRHARHPLGADLLLPLTPTQGERVDVNVWSDTLSGLAPSSQADEWISALTGPGSRLVFMDEACRRPIKTPGGDAPDGDAGDTVSFADAYPLLLISEASLAALNQRLADPVAMARFRPNLVVSGCGPHDEDGWTRLRIGSVEFFGVSACARCVFTTVDPATGQRHPNQEPLRTLSGYRRRGQEGVFFGQNLIPRGSGKLSLGNSVTIIG